MTDGAKTRVGVVGVGKMGRFHLQKYLALPEAEVVGFFEPDRARCSEIEKELGVPAFSDLGDLLFEVDAVTIASPTHSHAPLACQALESGVHVLVEKPISSTVPEALKMLQLARHHRLVLQVGMVERFRVLALAKGLDLRNPLFVEMHRLTPRLSRESSIDVVSDLMIHDLDLALSLVSEDPIVVSAIGMKVVTPQCDLANVRLEFPNGSVMNLNASRVSIEPYRKLRVFTRHTYASFDLHGNTAVLARKGENGLDQTVHEAPGFDPLLEQNRDFVRCVREGASPIVDGNDGLRALKYAQEVIFKIEERESTLRNHFLLRSTQEAELS